MKYGVYSIRDARVGFMTPTIDNNDESAIRNFYHSISQSEGILFTYAKDFDLYKVADFDSESGQMFPITPVVFLAAGSDALKEVRHDA